MRYLTIFGTGFLICCSHALAHMEAVRVEAIFPTAGRSGVQVQLVGMGSNAKISGAKLVLEIRGANVDSTQAFIESPLGIYRVDRGFQEGSYVFKIIDNTFDSEALTQEVSADLPRPYGQDVQIWEWPATPPIKPKPNQSLLIALLGIPILLIATVLGLFLWTRSKPKPTAGI